MSKNLNQVIECLDNVLSDVISAQDIDSLGLCSKSTFNSLICRRKVNIPFIKLGRNRIFKKKDFLDFIRSCYVRGNK